MKEQEKEHLEYFEKEIFRCAKGDGKAKTNKKNVDQQMPGRT